MAAIGRFGTRVPPRLQEIIQDCRARGQLVQGPHIEAFENAFARMLGSGHVRTCSTEYGRMALYFILKALDLPAGSEVVVPALTFWVVPEIVRVAGLKPVFADIDPATFTLSPDAFQRALTPRTSAVIPTHLYGLPCDMDPILAIARRHGIPVIEDAAQAHGSEYQGRRCGSMGLLGCFSFYPGKNLGAYGEGGAVVTDDPALAARIRLLRAWGEEVRYEHKFKAFNYRMDGVQGAVLGVKLRHLDAWTEARRANAAEYARQLAGTAVTAPVERAGCRHVYHLYPVRLAQRDAWRAALGEAGVQTGVHYPIPVHLQPAYRDLGYTAGDFPVSEHVAGEVLSLPMFPELTAAQIGTVAGLLKARLPVGSTA